LRIGYYEQVLYFSVLNASVLNASDWKWTPVQARLPANAQTVAIKFWDGRQAVRYGIGWYNEKEQSWVVTAEPNLFDGFLVPMEWMALPD